MKRIIPFAHQLIEEITKEGDFVVDATCGNGNDTLFLSNLVGNEGHVYASDIQEQAIATTKELLSANNCDNVTYIQDNHAKLNQYLSPSLLNNLSAAIFNLGYLPKSDKRIITKPESTILAIQKLLPFLKTKGRIIIVIYHGHIGGEQEKEAVLQYAQQLDQATFEVLQYQFINQRNSPPFIVAIEKK